MFAKSWNSKLKILRLEFLHGIWRTRRGLQPLLTSPLAPRIPPGRAILLGSAPPRWLFLIFSSKRTPKWIQKATKMGPQITNKTDFWDLGAFWKKLFFQCFWKQKKWPKIRKNSEENQRGGTKTTEIARPSGMRGASGEVRRGWRPLRVRQILIKNSNLRIFSLEFQDLAKTLSLEF